VCDQRDAQLSRRRPERKGTPRHNGGVFFCPRPTDSILQEGLRARHVACRVFLEENQSPRSGYGPPYEAQLHSTLGELRGLFGVHIARIACAYDLEVDSHLEGILPPEPD
jgi:hypothetical protein